MSGRKIVYCVEPYKAHPDALAEQLKLFGVELLRYDGFVGCIEYRDDEGDLVREIGYLFHYDDGSTVAKPCSDANPAEQIVLLRSAEEAQRDGYDFSGWGNHDDQGQKCLWTVIMIILEDGHGRLAEKAAARIPHNAFSQQRRGTEAGRLSLPTSPA